MRKSYLGCSTTICLLGKNKNNFLIIIINRKTNNNDKTTTKAMSKIQLKQNIKM